MFLDATLESHNSKENLPGDFIDDVPVLRRCRPASGSPNPWSHPLPEFSFVNSQIRVKFLSNPALPSCSDALYPDDSWATKNYLLAAHTEKDFHMHPIADFSPWIPPVMAGAIPYDARGNPSRQHRVLVQERTEDFGNVGTSWEIVPTNQA